MVALDVAAAWVNELEFHDLKNFQNGGLNASQYNGTFIIPFDLLVAVHGSSFNLTFALLGDQTGN